MPKIQRTDLPRALRDHLFDRLRERQIITLCDQPHITASHLRDLASSGAPIAATGYSGTIGVPAFFSVKFRNELLDLPGDVGAKRLLHEHRTLVAPIRFQSASFDIDRRV